MAGIAVLTVGSGRVAAAPTNCPPGVVQQACPVPKRDLPRYLNIVGANAGPAAPYVLGDAFRLKAGERARPLVGYDPEVATRCCSPPTGAI